MGMIMKNYAVMVLAVLLLPVCFAVRWDRSCTVLALADSELAYVDNISSGDAYETIENDGAYRNPPSDDARLLSWMRHFPWDYYDPYYYYPYAVPYSSAYGYPWHCYDDEYYHKRDWQEHRDRSGSDVSGVLKNIRRQRQERRENSQSFMQDRRKNRIERFENIRDGLFSGGRRK